MRSAFEGYVEKGKLKGFGRIIDPVDKEAYIGFAEASGNPSSPYVTPDCTGLVF